MKDEVLGFFSEDGGDAFWRRRETMSESSHCGTHPCATLRPLLLLGQTKISNICLRPWHEMSSGQIAVFQPHGHVIYAAFRSIWALVVFNIGSATVRYLIHLSFHLSNQI